MIMKEPMLTPSGFSYEKYYIEEHLKFNSIDPLSRQPITRD